MGKRSRTDVLIVTAAAGEDEAVLAVKEGAVGDWVETPHQGNQPFQIFEREFAAVDGNRLKVSLCRPHRMGGDFSASTVGYLTAHLRPRYIAMCGVCAGRPGWTKLGDVIVAEELWRYDEGEYVKETSGAPAVLFPQALRFQLGARWMLAARKLLDEDWTSLVSQRPLDREYQRAWLLRELFENRDPSLAKDKFRSCPDWPEVIETLERSGHVEFAEGLLRLTSLGRNYIAEWLYKSSDIPTPPAPWSIHVGPLGTGNNLVRDAGIWQRLREQQRLVLGLDMEGAVIALAGYLHDIRSIIVKGVMDYADPDRHRGFRAFAAQAAAEVLIRFLRRNIKAVDRRRGQERGSHDRRARKRSLRIAMSLPGTHGTVLGRARELRALSTALRSPRFSVISIVGWGGVGKTALVKHWLGMCAARGWREVDTVFAWSFPSQGTSGSRSSSDVFFDKALQFYGDPSPLAGSPGEKGRRLADLISRGNFILVLDGLEPFQHPPGPLGGRLKDAALEALLAHLAHRKCGLCVLTTRLPVAELEHLHNKTCMILPLGNLTRQNATRLLEQRGVQGTPEQLLEAVHAVDCHPLALVLLASWIVDTQGKDVTSHRKLTLLDEDGEQGGQAWRVMRSYDRWLAAPELAMLRLFGFFERPAHRSEIDKLIGRAPIPDLTDAMASAGSSSVERTLRRLSELGLIATLDEKIVDAHPLVREYQARVVREVHPDAWREGNLRLFRHLAEDTTELPGTAWEIERLYECVTHGCKAGEYDEAWSILERRIWQGKYFSTNTLGMISSECAALGEFFDVPFKTPAARLQSRAHGALLNQSAFCLRSVLRLEEAAEAFAASCDLRCAQREWDSAAINALSYAQIKLLTGAPRNAMQFAERAIQYADQGNSNFWKASTRGFVAYLHAELGQLEAADQFFAESLQVQQRDEPERSRLHSVRGALRCDYLLGLVADDVYGSDEQPDRALIPLNEILDSAHDGINIARTENKPYIEGLFQLQLARASLYRAMLTHADLNSVEPSVDAAFSLFKSARVEEQMPQVYLLQAEFYRVAAAEAASPEVYLQRADDSLTLAEEIARHGPMLQHRVRIELERARWILVAAKTGRAKAMLHARRAREIVVEHGFRRWAKQVDALLLHLDGVVRHP